MARPARLPRWRLACAAALTAGAWLASADAGRAQFGTRVTLVEVYATVVDEGRRPVTTLRREDFRVLDNGQARPIGVFAAGDFPLSVAVAVDRSWSMAGARLDQARRAALQFLGELREADEAMLIGVSSEVETLAPLSTDRQAQRDALLALAPWGATRLNDAVLEALGRVEAAHGRRALVVLSDGQDRESRASDPDVLDRVRHGDVLVYPVVVSRRNSAMLAQAATLSGGRAFWLKDPDEIVQAFTTIAQELRQQYLVGYVLPDDVTRDEWRRITLDVPGRKVTVRARPGYYPR